MANEREQLDIDDELESWEEWFASLPAAPPRDDEHECFYRGCKEVVAGKYHCDRHEAILERQQAATLPGPRDRRALTLPAHGSLLVVPSRARATLRTSLSL